MSDDTPVTEEQYRLKADQYERLLRQYLRARACPLLIEALLEIYIEHAAQVREYVDAELICIERSTAMLDRAMHERGLSWD